MRPSASGIVHQKRSSREEISRDEANLARERAAGRELVVIPERGVVDLLSRGVDSKPRVIDLPSRRVDSKPRVVELPSRRVDSKPRVIELPSRQVGSKPPDEEAYRRLMAANAPGRSPGFAGAAPAF